VAVAVGVAVVVAVVVAVGVDVGVRVPVAVAAGVAVALAVAVGVAVAPPAAGSYAMIALAHTPLLPLIVHPVEVEDELPGIRYALRRFVPKGACPPALRNGCPVKPFVGPDPRVG
jgi:hypothetical protein